MSYPRFKKIIIDYFMSKDQSILRRNKMFWHTARDDTMFTSMRCISRHEDTQVYGTILPKELTNQAMLESNAYKTYYDFAFGEKTPKPRYVRKKDDSDTSPKQKPVQATKGTRIKSKAKVSKSDKKKQPAKKPKAKGLVVLSKVALTEAEQLKLAIKRSKTQFHSSHTSGLGDGVDTQSKVTNEQHLETTGADKGTGIIPGVPDVPIYESKSEKESSSDSEDEDEDDENDSDDLSNDNNDEEEEEERFDDEEMMNDDEDDEVTKELYEDVNVNLGNKDTEMTNVDQGASEQQNVSQEYGFEKEEEDTHVTLTPVLDTQKADKLVQSSFVSFDFTSKLLNLENPSPANNEIASLMETLAHHATTVPENTLGFTTTIPPPPPFNDRITNLEKHQSEIKQVDQYAQDISSIPAIVDRYMDNKLGEAINKAILAHTLDCRQEAHDEKNDYIELIDTLMRALIKEEKPIQATKGTRIKSKAKVSNSDKKKQPVKKPKAKGLAILFEVVLTKAEQLKLATKRSKIQFHSSHVSGSGDGVNTQSKYEHVAMNHDSSSAAPIVRSTYRFSINTARDQVEFLRNLLDRVSQLH
ncbi:hypothetical protein Tco_0883124 [Tanacetum coccineum]